MDLSILIWEWETIMELDMAVMLLGWTCIIRILEEWLIPILIKPMCSERKFVSGVKSTTNTPIIPKYGLDRLLLPKEYGILRTSTSSLISSEE
jgi:hypothetical protein